MNVMIIYHLQRHHSQFQILITSHGEVGVLKLKKGWNYSAGAVLLKRRWPALFLIDFVKVYHFSIRYYFILCKIMLYVALCYHNFMKKSHSKLSKNEHENVLYKLRFISLLVKGFKRLKIDF